MRPLRLDSTPLALRAAVRISADRAFRFATVSFTFRSSSGSPMSLFTLPTAFSSCVRASSPLFMSTSMVTGGTPATFSLAGRGSPGLAGGTISHPSDPPAGWVVMVKRELRAMVRLG